MDPRSDATTPAEEDGAESHQALWSGPQPLARKDSPPPFAGALGSGSDPAEGECYSCRLWLDDVAVCPGCGAVQAVEGAQVDAPRCAEHSDRVAAFTCGRCGAYGCAQCEVEDSGGCWACLPSRAEVLGKQLDQVRRRMLWCVFAFAVLAPMVALSVHQVPLAAVLCVLSGFIVSLSVNAFVHRDFSAFALSLAGLCCILLLFLLGQTLLALIPILAAVWLFVQMNRFSELEIERWRVGRLYDVIR